MLDITHRAAVFKTLGVDMKGSRTIVANPENCILWADSEVRCLVRYVMSLQHFGPRLMTDMKEGLNWGINSKPGTPCRKSIVRHQTWLN
jgi:hypothetical protein